MGTPLFLRLFFDNFAGFISCKVLEEIPSISCFSAVLGMLLPTNHNELGKRLFVPPFLITIYLPNSTIDAFSCAISWPVTPIRRLPIIRCGTSLRHFIVAEERLNSG